MTELKNITMIFSDGRKAAEHFSFALNDGDKVAVIGEEGNGKSTLLKLINDPASVADYCTYTGSIINKGKIGYLPQFMPEKELLLPVSEYMAGGDTEAKVSSMTEMGIPASVLGLSRTMGTLSGGEKVKYQMVKLLSQRPDILLLDEPTNDLDTEALEWLEGFILSSPLPVMFVSHDETLIENAANTIIHMEQLIRKTVCRVTVARCGYGEYIERRGLLYDKQLKVALKERSNFKAKQERLTKITDRVDYEQDSVSRGDPAGARLLKKKMKSLKSQEKRLEREEAELTEIPEREWSVITEFDPSISVPRSKSVLDFSVPALFAGEKKLSDGISLTVTGSEHIGITGSNGAGKSTLLSLIWNTLKDRKDISAAYMPQAYSEVLDFSLTPVEFLAASYSKNDVTRARTFMGSMKFTHTEMLEKIGRLSGGQKAKLLFLDMVIRNANVLVLDEPTRNFSPLSGPVIRKTLSDFGGAIISVSHDRKYLSEVCDKVYILDTNGLRLQG